MVVDEQGSGEDVEREAQEARAASHFFCLVEIAGEDLLLDA